MRKKLKNIKWFVDKLRREDKYANPQFNKIPKYYINLDRSKYRNKYMLKQCIDYEVENIERFKAVDGNDIIDKSKGEIDGIKYINDYPNCTEYQLAITLSHLECMRKAGEKGVFPFIIMEDDADFLLINKWKININQVIQEMPENCDIIHLFNSDANFDINKKYRKNRDEATGGVCYIVTENCYNKLINLLYENKKWSLKDKLQIKNIIFDSGIMKLFNYYRYSIPMILQHNGDLRSCHDKRYNGDEKYNSIFFRSVRYYM